MVLFPALFAWRIRHQVSGAPDPLSGAGDVDQDFPAANVFRGMKEFGLLRGSGALRAP